MPKRPEPTTKQSQDVLSEAVGKNIDSRVTKMQDMVDSRGAWWDCQKENVDTPWKSTRVMSKCLGNNG